MVVFKMAYNSLCECLVCCLACWAEEEQFEGEIEPPTADPDLGASKEAVRTDAEAVERYNVVRKLS